MTKTVAQRSFEFTHVTLKHHGDHAVLLVDYEEALGGPPQDTWRIVQMMRLLKRGETITIPVDADTPDETVWHFTRR